MTMQGLFVAACPDEALRFFSFLAGRVHPARSRAAPADHVRHRGERDLSERELPHLSGWRDSAPVRTGNGAWQQSQLDVYGAVLDAAYTLRDELTGLDRATRSFLIAAVDAAATRWPDDDQGIWEMRGPARAYLHSKLMCWVAVDLGLALRELPEPDEERVATWMDAATRSEAILSQGWSDDAGSFTQSFGSGALDASGLLLAIVGFLAIDDPRLLATIDAIERKLSDERGLLFRYRGNDGLDGEEGTFLLCTFWLAHALAVTGQPARAHTVLNRATRYATDLGLLPNRSTPPPVNCSGTSRRPSAISDSSPQHTLSPKRNGRSRRA